MSPAGRAARWAVPLALGLAFLGVACLLLALVVLPSGRGWGYDLEAYLNAAVRLAEGGSLYQPETLGGPFEPGPHGLYLYPPPLGVALLPVTAIDTRMVETGWYLARVVALGLACAILPVRPAVRLLTFAAAAFSAAALTDLSLGNVSVLLLLPLAVMWRWLDRPAGSVALALGLTVRPTLGIFLLWWLLRRRLRPVLWTLVSGAVLVVLTLPFVGLGGYSEYLTVLRNVSGAPGVPVNLDLRATALALGWGETAALTLLLAGFGLGIGAVLLSLRRDREVGFMVTLGASLLLAPLLHDHYLVVTALTGAFLAERGRPLALALPLLMWMPDPLHALIAVAATTLPFAAKDVRPATWVTIDDLTIRAVPAAR